MLNVALEYARCKLRGDSDRSARLAQLVPDLLSVHQDASQDNLHRRLTVLIRSLHDSAMEYETYFYEKAVEPDDTSRGRQKQHQSLSRLSKSFPGTGNCLQAVLEKNC